MILNEHYLDEELSQIPFKSIGKNVQIDKTIKIIYPEQISIGNNVRIDGFCTLIGKITIGSHVHIGGYCYLGGSDGIELMDFSGISQRTSIYSRSDDYSGEKMTNPTVPEDLTGVYSGKVTLGRHVIIGASSIILPNLSIGDGCAIGAFSLVTKSLAPWGIYFGVPVQFRKNRKQTLLVLEKKII